MTIEIGDTVLTRAGIEFEVTDIKHPMVVLDHHWVFPVKDVTKVA